MAGMGMDGVMRDPTTAAYFVLCVITSPIVVAATGLRFYATHRSGRPIGLEDWFALVACLTHLIHVVLSCLALQGINGRELITLMPDEILYVGKLSYAATPIFPIQQFFAKFSILFLYHRIFAVKKSFVQWIYFIGALQIIYSVMTFFVSLFGCSPVERGWNFLITEGKCVNRSDFLAGSEALNSGVDFAMVILAVVMIRDLKMKASTKWKLAILFALGGLAGVVGFVKVGEAYKAGGTVNITSGLWTTIQQACSVVCCCAPIYRSLLPKKNKTGGAGTGYSGKPSMSEHTRSSADGRPTLDESSNEALQTERWLHLDGSSQRGLAWTDIEAAEVSSSASTPSIQPPTRTVQVKQSVDIV